MQRYATRMCFADQLLCPFNAHGAATSTLSPSVLMHGQCVAHRVVKLPCVVLPASSKLSGAVCSYSDYRMAVALDKALYEQVYTTQ
eukprot:5910-Heterococcus_DN1.PRE.1